MFLPLVAAALAAQAAAGSPAPRAAPAPHLAADADWREIPSEDLLVLTLEGGRRVFIRLAPGFAPVHVENMRKLARAGWWDGAHVRRVQDNHVVQWGAEKPLPPGVVEKPPAEYMRPGFAPATTLARPDSYAARVGHSADGWPLASDGRETWLPHCYGMVGVARDLAPDTGTGAEPYVVIGHAPRFLDGNIAMVGRVIEGVQHLSALPRGGGQRGFYQPGETRPLIVSVRLASDLPAAERPRFQYRATDNPRFQAYIASRENWPPPFVMRPAGGVDICNVEPQARRAPEPAS